MSIDLQSRALAMLIAERNGLAYGAASSDIQQTMTRMQVWLQDEKSAVARAAQWAESYNRQKAAVPHGVETDLLKSLVASKTSLAELSAWHHRGIVRANKRAELEGQVVPLAEALEAAGVKADRLPRVATLLQEIAAEPLHAPKGARFVELRGLTGHAAALPLIAFARNVASAKEQIAALDEEATQDPAPMAEPPVIASLRGLVDVVAEGAKQVAAAEELKRLESEREAQRARDARIQELERSGARI